MFLAPKMIQVNEFIYLSASQQSKISIEGQLKKQGKT